MEVAKEEEERRWGVLEHILNPEDRVFRLNKRISLAESTT